MLVGGRERGFREGAWKREMVTFGIFVFDCVAREAVTTTTWQ